MINVNEFVIYESQGVCEIIAIEQDLFNPNKAYYVLKPLHGHLIIKTSVNNEKVTMRQILNKNEVNELIKSMDKVEPIWIEDTKLRIIKFKSLLNTGKCKDLIIVIKSLHLKNLERLSQKKTITVSDKVILDTAINRLHEEFAFSLKIPLEEVEEYILGRAETV